MRSLLLVASLCLFAACDQAADLPAPLPEGVDRALLEANMEVVATGFTIPWGIEVLAEDTYLLTERHGRLWYVVDGEATTIEGTPRTQTIIFESLVYGGYMDVSLHPQFDTNGLVYLAYVNQAGVMAVARFNFDERTVKDLEVVFESNAFSIGSRIVWEDDEHFFVTQGLGGNPYPEPGPQDLRNDGGKIHRLMADGSIPADNPVFESFDEPSSVWSLGHRDPQGLYYDAEADTLYATEHGPLGGDEFNVIVKGGNYGWPLFSHGLNYNRTPVSTLSEADVPDTILPRRHWDEHLNVAPSGLERLENSVFPAWEGFFVLGSLAQQRLLAYDVETNYTAILLENMGRVRDVVQLPSDSLLLLIDAGSPGASDPGRVVKVTPR